MVWKANLLPRTASSLLTLLKGAVCELLVSAVWFKDLVLNLADDWHMPRTVEKIDFLTARCCKRNCKNLHVSLAHVLSQVGLIWISWYIKYKLSTLYLNNQLEFYLNCLFIYTELKPKSEILYTDDTAIAVVALDWLARHYFYLSMNWS